MKTHLLVTPPPWTLWRTMNEPSLLTHSLIPCCGRRFGTRFLTVYTRFYVPSMHAGQIGVADRKLNQYNPTRKYTKVHPHHWDVWLLTNMVKKTFVLKPGYVLMLGLVLYGFVFSETRVEYSARQGLVHLAIVQRYTRLGYISFWTAVKNYPQNVTVEDINTASEVIPGLFIPSRLLGDEALKNIYLGSLKKYLGTRGSWSFAKHITEL